ncbi:cytochrome BC1 synthesis [Striga hermonthica]|uniref:Cytochrome BC1 synthesis n=1 Tax=Striga hermonthica TaxID=68872 RepID=A0A9N7NPY2_STRHE|nr:cytochrome BC1 synthesis [Striga hermonthica]
MNPSTIKQNIHLNKKIPKVSNTSSEFKLDTAKTILSAAGSAAATAVLIRSVARDLLPPEFQVHIFSGIRRLLSSFSNQLTMVIDEFDRLDPNDIYQSAQSYLGPKISPNTRRLKISRPEKENHYKITMEKDGEIVDTYAGVKFKWAWICRKTESLYNPRGMNSTLKLEVRSFELTFHRRHKDLVVNSYLPHIAAEAKREKYEKRTLKIHTIDGETLSYADVNDVWTPATFDHPATFDTLAIDPEQKGMILQDLERFLGRREFYRNVGKAWKRGYLLYGPPGTGKSSLIAAIANYLKFDVYDLELTEVHKNSDLRKLMVGTANRSVLVVEDIDCTIDLQKKLAKRDASKEHKHNSKDESKVTLSSVLNYVDGLWSSCGDERIIIFTTNHVERLDPALLRPGRMDVHINLSYCTPSGFRLLASNYLGVKEHVMFDEIEDLIRNAKTTPAEVAEELLKDDNADVALKGLIDFMHKKIKKNEEKNEEDEKVKTESGGKKESDEENGEVEETLEKL